MGIQFDDIIELIGSETSIIDTVLKIRSNQDPNYQKATHYSEEVNCNNPIRKFRSLTM